MACAGCYAPKEGFTGPMAGINIHVSVYRGADENIRKHKVPTLQNADKKPGAGFTKAYMHNGVFKSLKKVFHFYNTRDVETWPDPEAAENVNEEEP